MLMVCFTCFPKKNCYFSKQGNNLRILEKHFKLGKHQAILLSLETEQGITFEKVRRVTNRSPKMTISSIGSDF